MRLILLRHAKSAWGTDAPSDHARPLNKRGRGDAPRIGAELHARGWVPDVVCSSDAQRTRETWARMAPTLAEDAPVLWVPTLYLASAQTILTVALKRAEDTIMVIGHNPGMEDLVSALSQEAHRFTTCNAAMFERSGQRWALAGLLRPRELA